MKLKPFLLGVALGCLYCSAHAEFYDGNQLKGNLDKLKSQQADDKVAAALGSGYVVGIHDATTGIAVCAPQETTVAQLNAATSQYMRDNPEVLDHTADIVVAHALKAQWPCGGDAKHTWYESGNDLKPLLEQFERNADTTGGALGLGYVMGVHDALAGGLVCTSRQVTAGQVASVILKYMNNNPEILDNMASVVVAKGLEAVWPCKKKPTEGTTGQPKAAPRTSPQKPRQPTTNGDSPF